MNFRSSKQLRVSGHTTLIAAAFCLISAVATVAGGAPGVHLQGDLRQAVEEQPAGESRMGSSELLLCGLSRESSAG